jgi:uncharacterized protein (DUF2062 family)
VASGVFWGLTPTVGLQTIEILATWGFLKHVVRKDSSLVQAMLWVWVNNPLTMVPLYYAFYVTGLSLTGRRGVAVDYQSFTVTGLSLDNVGVPLLIGCLPYATVGSALAYFWAIGVVTRRRVRLARKRATASDYGTFRT